MSERVCTCCKKLLPIDAFRQYRLRSGEIAHRYECKKCVAKKYYAKYLKPQRQTTEGRKKKNLQDQVYKERKKAPLLPAKKAGKAAKIEIKKIRSSVKKYFTQKRQEQSADRKAIINGKALCSGCHEWVPVEMYCADPGKLNGLQSRCKVCEADRRNLKKLFNYSIREAPKDLVKVNNTRLALKRYTKKRWQEL